MSNYARNALVEPESVSYGLTALLRACTPHNVCHLVTLGAFGVMNLPYGRLGCMETATYPYRSIPTINPNTGRRLGGAQRAFLTTIHRMTIAGQPATTRAIADAYDIKVPLSDVSPVVKALIGMGYVRQAGQAMGESGRPKLYESTLCDQPNIV